MARWEAWDGTLPLSLKSAQRSANGGDVDPMEHSPEVVQLLRRANELAAQDVSNLSSSLLPTEDSSSLVKRCTASHVAYVLLSEVLSEMGLPTPWGADIPSVLKALRQTSLERLESEEDMKQDSLAHLLRSARAQRPFEPGPTELQDICRALFEPAVGLEPVLREWGLTSVGLVAVLPTSAMSSRETTSAPLPPSVSTKPPSATRDKGSARDWNERADPFGALSSTGGGQTNASDAEEVSALQRFGRDLVAEAAEGKLDIVVGRDDDVDRVLRVLSRRNKPNVCLYGEPGVGKTAVVEEVARRIHEGQVPRQLMQCKRLIQLSLGSLVGGTRYRGEFEQRMQQLLSELLAAGDEVILFIDELHMALGAGETEKGGTMDAANLLKPALARGELRCIGATTTSEYRRLIQGKDKAFERRFVTIEVKEPTEDAAEKMLDAIRPALEKHHRVSVAPEALRASVRASRVLRDRFLPDRALDVLDDAATLASIEFKGQNGDHQPPVCTQDHVQQVVQEAASRGTGTREFIKRLFSRPWSRL